MDTEDQGAVEGGEEVGIGKTVNSRSELHVSDFIQYNDKIKTFYERLVTKHKPKKVAVIAAMRKLLLIAHAIYKNKTVYVPR